MGVVAYPVCPEAKIAMIDPRDVGVLAAKLVVAADPSLHHGKKLDISGPETVNCSQLAALYTEALGRPINAVNCPKADWIAGAVCINFLYWDEGKLTFPSAPEVLALAAPQRTIAEWVKEWAPRSPPPAV